jgi:hypothetical protein
MSAEGQSRRFWAGIDDFRFSPDSDRIADIAGGPFGANTGSGTGISHVSGACEDRAAPGSVDTAGRLKPSALWLAVLSFRVCQMLGRVRAGLPTER